MNVARHGQLESEKVTGKCPRQVKITRMSGNRVSLVPPPEPEPEHEGVHKVTPVTERADHVAFSLFSYFLFHNTDPNTALILVFKFF